MILDDVEDAIRKYVVLNDEQYAAVTLWVAATHGINVWEHATRLAILSPVKGCGKTRLMEVLIPLSYNPMAAASVTVAALFRKLANGPRTIFHDEADTVFGNLRAIEEGTSTLRAFYNGGFTPEFTISRCVGVGAAMKVQDFPAFAMAALASKTHDLPDTIQDRAVVIRMRKRTTDEEVSDFRARRDKPMLQEMGGDLGDWIDSHIGKLEGAEPKSRLRDRVADVWESLLAVADVAGDGWDEKARWAASALARSERNDDSGEPGERLVRDLKRIWPDRDFWPTRSLMTALHNDRDSDWNHFEYGRPITDVQVAALLRPYQVKPRQRKVAGKPVRGFDLAAFTEVWRRYK